MSRALTPRSAAAWGSDPIGASTGVRQVIPGARFVAGCGLAIALLFACRTPPPGGTLSGSPNRATPRPANSPSPPETKVSERVDPKVQVDRRVQGRVVSVNAALRFVVIDFPIWRMPVPEQRLNVYRAGQKVGEVKITGPAIETTVAGIYWPARPSAVMKCRRIDDARAKTSTGPPGSQPASGTE